MRLILIAFLLLPSVAFANYEATARQCRAACAKIPDEAKRVECVAECSPLGAAPFPAERPPPQPAPVENCEDKGTCDSKKKPPKDETPPRNGAPDRSPSSGPQPVDPSPHIILSAGPNAQHCTERRENCRNLDRLCRNGSGAACASAAKRWTKVNTDCGV